ncbi:hypothetical protein BDW59DRAFT_150950 [Aspergillus cavernicola]|uniref:F-box domain-containing protein n=1 Tax=Aspergillus cavernicola TaxID=176166 RepID=A0ABR4HXV6_9EURO
MQSTMQSTQLPFLVDDLWHIIIDILSHPPSPNDSNVEDETEDRGPPKRLHVLIHLSSTCKWLRGLLVPRIFESLYLKNTVKSALSIQAIAHGNHSACVKNLHYIGICEEDQLDSPLPEVYPPEVNNILSNLSLFPNLQHLSIDFPMDSSELWQDTFNEPFNPSREDALAQEEEDTWYGLMASSFNAIASNNPIHFHSLELHHLNVAEISTFTTPAFRTLISQLKSFNLSLEPLDNGAGWQFNWAEIFHGFADRFAPWFTDHLHSVEEFTLDPSESAVLGDSGQPYGHDISLADSNMPRLRKLTLRNIIVCVELRDFILRHLTTLEEVVLQECYAIQTWDAVTWYDLFTPLAQAFSTSSPTCLKSVKVCYDNPQDEMLDLNVEWSDPDLVARAQAKIAAEPAARAFFYGAISDKYGYLLRDSDKTLELFLRGDDARSYQDLMDVLEGNASHGGDTTVSES